MSLQEGWLRQACLPRFHAKNGWPCVPITSERNGQHRIGSLAEISSVQRDDHDRVFLASGIGGPDLAAPWLRNDCRGHIETVAMVPWRLESCYGSLSKSIPCAASCRDSAIELSSATASGERVSKYSAVARASRRRFSLRRRFSTASSTASARLLALPDLTSVVRYW